MAQSQRGGGIGKYLNPRGLRIIDTLVEVAEQSGAKPAEVALAWLMSREGVTAPIASATSLAQVESFARAAALSLSATSWRVWTAPARKWPVCSAASRARSRFRSATNFKAKPQERAGRLVSCGLRPARLSVKRCPFI
jgi:diketogulonate reductase-like aldo/keto reductase